MKRSTILIAGLLSSILTAGCGNDAGLRTLPNDLPIAIALIDNGDENAAEQRLGYIIRGEVAGLDASRSFDPDNAGSATELSYRWAFDAMPGDSSLQDADILSPEDDPDTPDVDEGAWASFTPDVLGVFRLQLVVTDDDDGESNPAIVVVVSSPASNLLVQLDWSDTQADLDLHLIASGGSYFGSGDCFSWDPNPNWGDAELASDNPVLDYDDDGEGPAPYRESISFDEPNDGDYEVWVHYYSDHAQTLGHSAVAASPILTVTVFGEVIWDESLPDPTPSSPLMAGDVWKAGVIGWPDRSWSPIDLISDHSSEGGPNYNGDDGSGDGSN
jgi:hypothetical protein